MRRGVTLERRTQDAVGVSSRLSIHHCYRSPLPRESLYSGLNLMVAVFYVALQHWRDFQQRHRPSSITRKDCYYRESMDEENNAGDL